MISNPIITMLPEKRLLRSIPHWFMFLALIVSARADTVYTSPYVFSTLAGTSSIGSNDGPGSVARFQSPRGLTVDNTGIVYVADTVNGTIRKITPDGIVSTLAGVPQNMGFDLSQSPGFPDGTGSNAYFFNPEGIALDPEGNLIVADKMNFIVRKVTPAGVVTTLAGKLRTMESVDGTGSAAHFDVMGGLAVDSTGNIYVAEWNKALIRKITPAGVVTTLAGSAGLWGSADGTGSEARFLQPYYVAVDSTGTLYVSDAGNCNIRKITPAGVVSTFAGLAMARGSADGAGSAARFLAPEGIAVDQAGNVYVADAGNSTIRKITPGGVVTTFAGTAGAVGSADGIGTNARFRSPIGLAVDATGTVYVSDGADNTIRKISPAGEVSTLAGLATDHSLGSADGTAIEARFQAAIQVAAGPAGDTFVTDTLNRTVRQIAASGSVTTLAGSSADTSPGIVDGPASTARFVEPGPIAADAAGTVFVGEKSNGTVRKISAAKIVSTLNASARFGGVGGVAIDAAGNVYVSDDHKHTVNRISPAGVITTLAGSTGIAGSTDGSGVAASFNQPAGLAVDPAGNLFVADTNNHLIRKITSDGQVTTVAGAAGQSGEADGLASNARFNFPSSVSLDPAGNLFVADSSNSTVRQITPAGMVSTVAGSPQTAGYADGAGAQVRFDHPGNISVNAAGNLFVSSGSTIRKGQLAGPPLITLQPQSQTVTVGKSAQLVITAIGATAPTYQWYFNGNPLSGATGSTLSLAAVHNSDAGNYTVIATNSLGSATSQIATLTVSAVSSAPTITTQPASANVTASHGATFSAGDTNGSIQWQISTDGGTTWSNLANNSTYSGVTTTTLTLSSASPTLNGAKYRFVATSNGLASTSSAATLTVAPAFFPFPASIAIDAAGNLYVGDTNTEVIQKISPSGQVSLVAGTSGAAGTADGVASAARFNQPAGLALSAQGVLFVADTANATIRRIGADGTVTTFAGSPSNRGNVDGTASAALFSLPSGLALDANGSLYVADATNNTVRKIAANGLVTTLAGTAGAAGSTDGAGTTARFNLPTGIAVDAGGAVYVADTTNNTIRKITPAGLVTTLAGLSGVSGFADGTGDAALFNHPGGLAADSAGNLYLADTGNSIIRKITPAGVVSTLAGLPGIAGLKDGAGSSAFFNQPQSLALDSAGNLYVADTGNATIRKITAIGTVSTLTLSAAPAPAPTPTPTPSPVQNPAPTPAPTASSSGGGGSVEGWFALALVTLGGTRRWMAMRRISAAR